MTKPSKEVEAIKQKVEWDDKKKWQREVLTSVISYIVVTLLTIIIFMFWLDRKQHKWQANYDLRLQTFKDYEKASGLYLLNAYDAINDAYVGKTSDSSNNIKNWQKNDYDEMKTTQESLQRWFANGNIEHKLNGLLFKLDSVKYEFYKLIKSLNKEIKDNKNIYLATHTDSLWEKKDRKSLYTPIKEEYIKINEEILKMTAEELD